MRLVSSRPAVKLKKGDKDVKRTNEPIDSLDITTSAVFRPTASQGEENYQASRQAQLSRRA